MRCRDYADCFGVGLGSDCSTPSSSRTNGALDRSVAIGPGQNSSHNKRTSPRRCSSRCERTALHPLDVVSGGDAYRMGSGVGCREVARRGYVTNGQRGQGADRGDRGLGGCGQSASQCRGCLRASDSCATCDCGEFDCVIVVKGDSTIGLKSS